MYETDILDFDSIEDLEEASPIKSNKAIKRAARKASKQAAATTTQAAKGVVTKPVEAQCNKCKNKIMGELISDLYMPHIDKMVPVISYTCQGCGHIGRRSVLSLALPLDQYEKKYFN